MRRFLRDGGLSFAFLGLFLATILAQSFVGLAYMNEELGEHPSATSSS